jgi:hypothetical protein
MVEKYSNIRLNASRIKPISQGKGRAEQEWTNLTKRHSRKKRNGYRTHQFLVKRGFDHINDVRIDDIHRVTETVDCAYCKGIKTVGTDSNDSIVECPVCNGSGKGEPVSIIYGRYGTQRVMKSGDAVGMGPHNSTVGRWVFA